MRRSIIAMGAREANPLPLFQECEQQQRREDAAKVVCVLPDIAAAEEDYGDRENINRGGAGVPPQPDSHPRDCNEHEGDSGERDEIEGDGEVSLPAGKPIHGRVEDALQESIERYRVQIRQCVRFRAAVRYIKKPAASREQSARGGDRSRDLPSSQQK